MAFARSPLRDLRPRRISASCPVGVSSLSRSDWTLRRIWGWRAVNASKQGGLGPTPVGFETLRSRHGPRTGGARDEFPLAARVNDVVVTARLNRRICLAHHYAGIIIAAGELLQRSLIAEFNRRLARQGSRLISRSNEIAISAPTKDTLHPFQDFRYTSRRLDPSSGRILRPVVAERLNRAVIQECDRDF